MLNNGSNTFSSSLVSSVMVRSPSSMSFSSTPPICTLSTSIPSSSNMISKYLVQYVPVVAKKKKAGETRITGLCVLTNAERISILREKEEKKKEKEEKEKRNQERLNKKKEKDDLVKMKKQRKL